MAAGAPIVGGEEDQHAAYQMLKDYYVSRDGNLNPLLYLLRLAWNRAAKQIQNQYDWFSGYDKIIIGMDSDDAGEKQ